MSTEQSQFFLMRLWSDPAGDGKVEWHGRLQHVLSGEARTFHNWTTLIELLLEMTETDGLDGRAQGISIQEATP